MIGRGRFAYQVAARITKTEKKKPKKPQRKARAASLLLTISLE